MTCKCSQPWCDFPACRPHLGKVIIVKLAVRGLLPARVPEWLIRVLGWKGV